MQIVQAYPYPGSVNTAALADGAVTYAKLDISSVFGGSQMQTVTASGTVTIPTNTSRAWIRMVGGGGGGGGGATAGSGGGGAAGTYAEAFLTGLTAGNTLTATIGAKGTGGASGVDGTAGGETKLASGTQSITEIDAPGGGQGGNPSNSSYGGASGGAATAADLSLPGCPGGYGNASAATLQGGGGSNPLGYAVPHNDSFAGSNGTGYGAGGEGAKGGYAGGDGTAGVIVIVWLA